MKKILLLIIPFLLTGCYNYIELNNLDIVSSIYINYINNKYEISIELLNDNKILSYSDNSIKKTFLNIENNNNKKLIYSHLNSVFITKNVNLENIINYFLRQTDTNINFYLLYTDKNPFNKNIKLNVKNILDRYNFNDFINISKSYYNNKNILLPIYKDGLINNFYFEKINKTINLNEYYLYKLLNNETNSYFKINCDNNYFIININKVKYNKNNMVLESSIEEYNCNLDTTKIKDINKLEKLSNNYLNKELFKYYNINIKVNNHINKKGLLLK